MRRMADIDLAKDEPIFERSHRAPAPGKSSRSARRGAPAASLQRAPEVPVQRRTRAGSAPVLDGIPGEMPYVAGLQWSFGAPSEIQQRPAASPGTARPGACIQRYSVKLESGDPIPWSTETVDMKRHGTDEGAYFCRSDDGEVLVVKPIFTQRDVAGKEVAETFLSRGLKITVPDSRIVSADSEEGRDIVTAIKAKGLYLSGQPMDDTEVPKSITAFKIMRKVMGESLESLVTNAEKEDEEATRRLIAVLGTESILFKIGLLIVCDAFLYNDDRIKTFGVNAGNIIFDGKDVVAIDNDAVFSRIQPSSLGSKGRRELAFLVSLFNSTPPGKKFVNSFMTYVKEEGWGDRSYAERVDESIGWDNVRSGIELGVTAGIEQLNALFSRGTFMDEMKSKMEEFPDVDWESFVARVEHFSNPSTLEEKPPERKPEPSGTRTTNPFAGLFGQ